MKAIALNEAHSRLDQLFEDAQAGSPVLLVRGGEVAKLERVAPPEFGGDPATLERMLLDALEGPHPEWTPQDLADIARRIGRSTTLAPEPKAFRLVYRRLGALRSDQEVATLIHKTIRASFSLSVQNPLQSDQVGRNFSKA